MTDEMERQSKKNGHRNSVYMKQGLQPGLSAPASPLKKEAVSSQPQFRRSLELLRHLILHQSTVMDPDSSNEYSDIHGELILSIPDSLLNALVHEGGLELVLENAEESDGVETQEILPEADVYPRASDFVNHHDDDKTKRDEPQDKGIGCVALATPERNPSEQPPLPMGLSLRRGSADIPLHRILLEQRPLDQLHSPTLSIHSHHASMISTSLAGLGLNHVLHSWRTPGDVIARNRFNTLLDEINLKSTASLARSDSIGSSKKSLPPIQPLQIVAPHTEVLTNRLNYNGPKHTQNPNSPWNRIRVQTEDTQTKGKLFTKKNYLIPSTITEVSPTQIVEQLSKEVTSYQIQLMTCKQFTHHLIEKCRVHGIDTSNVEIHAQPRTSVHDKQAQNNLEGKLLKLQKEYNIIYKLNEDLYESVEGFENRIKTMVPILEVSSQVVGDILQTLIGDPKTDHKLRTALERCAEDKSMSLESKLKVVQFEIEKILENNRNDVFDEEEMENQVQVTERLMASIKSLQEEINKHKHQRELIEQDLRKEVNALKLVKQDFITILQKFADLCRYLELDSLQDKDAILMLELDDDQEVYRKVDAYNQDLMRPRDNVESMAHPSRYTLNVDNELKAEKQHNDYEKTINELKEQLEASKRSLSVQISELQKSEARFSQQEKELSDKIQTLNAQLRQSQHDVAQMRLKLRDFDQTKAELVIANQNGRNLLTENTRLRAKVNEHMMEKKQWQTTVDGLNERLRNGNVISESSRTSDISLKLDTLMHQDMKMLTRLWKLFDRIADDDLFKEPTKKLSVLQKVLENYQSEVQWDTSNEDVLGLHRYVSEYFSRAVDILVEDHVRILLETPLKEDIAQLHKRINELELQNDKLSGRYGHDGLQSDLDYNKLMTGEFRKKFQREREQRIFENDQASKRVRDLEEENAKLREALHYTTET